jgi:type I restriction enzyme, R subunit
MNEFETRAEHIDPALKTAGWGVVDGSVVRREYRITEGVAQAKRYAGKLAIRHSYATNGQVIYGIDRPQAKKAMWRPGPVLMPCGH